MTPEFEEFVAAPASRGLAVAYSQHTSCCVLLQEESEDATYYGTQYILQDTLNVLAKIAPPTRHENQYLHPGPIHIRNAAELRDELPEWGLNTDGHIIASILGRSETVPVRTAASSSASSAACTSATSTRYASAGEGPLSGHR